MSSNSRSRSPKKSKKRLYVTRYSLKENEDDIKKLFKEVGKVTEFSWKGKYCFIEYKTADDAESAIKKFNGEDHNGSTLLVEYSKGDPQSRSSGKCYNCGRSGHFAKHCRARSSSSSSSSSSRRKKHRKHKKRRSSSSDSESSRKRKHKKKSKKRKSSSSDSDSEPKENTEA